MPDFGVIIKGPNLLVFTELHYKTGNSSVQEQVTIKVIPGLDQVIKFIEIHLFVQKFKIHKARNAVPF